MFPKAYNHITETKVNELSYTNTVQTEFTNWFCYANLPCKSWFTQISQSKAVEGQAGSFSVKS